MSARDEHDSPSAGARIPTGGTSGRIQLRAPAKINLHLRVGPRRDDGFHPLLTWMCTVGLFDILIFERAGARPAATTIPASSSPPERALAHGQDVPSGVETGSGGAADVSLITDDPRLGTGAENLVVRAASALADTLAGRLGEGSARGTARGGATAAATGEIGSARSDRVSASSHSPTVDPPVRGPVPPDIGPVRIHLAKRIPSGGGLGGGSSDAAATLLGLARLWRLGWARQRLADVATRLGSDVPFFIHGPSSVCAGRGELVRPVAPPAARWAVLVLPPIVMPTPAVYRRFDELGLGSSDAITAEPDWQSWARLDVMALLPRLVNDLEPPAFALEPQLGRLRSDAEALLGRPVRMSGSGSSLFTLYDARADAADAARRVAERLGVRAVAVALGPTIGDDDPAPGESAAAPSDAHDDAHGDANNSAL